MPTFSKGFLLQVAASAALGLGTCFAQDDGSHRFVEKNDKDGDGKLTVEEFPERWRKMFKGLDADGDGFMTAIEHRAFREAAAAKGKQQAANAEAERDVAEQKTAAFFKRHDKDGDGKLTRENLPAWAQKAFEKMDANGDGILTKEEDTAYRIKNALRAAARKKQRQRMKPSSPPAHADVPYGEHEKQRFDIWLAESPSPTPLVIYIHGGGFRGGDKRAVNGPLLDRLLAHGMSFVSLNYRLTDVGPFPMQMHDCARALQHIRHHAADYNVDPKRVGLMGGSAGSGIAQWLAFHEDLAEPDSPDPIARQSTRVLCAVPYGAQCSYDPRFIAELFDTDQMHSCFIPFFGMTTAADKSNPKLFHLFEESSPITHLTADDAPIFLYYSQANEPLPKNSTPQQHIHHPKFGVVLKKRMDELGVECTLRLRDQSPTFPNDAVAAFFARHLGANSAAR